MKINEFRRMISAYGATAERWPIELRAPALALLARSDSARRLRAEAAGLDGNLDLAPAPGPAGGSLIGAIAALRPPADHPGTTAAAMDRESLLGWFHWPQLAALAMAGVLGFVVGWAQLEGTIFYDGTGDVTNLVFGAESIDELSL